METAAGRDGTEGEERDWSVRLEGTRDYGEFPSRSLSLSASSWYTAGSVSRASGQLPGQTEAPAAVRLSEQGSERDLTSPRVMRHLRPWRGAWTSRNPLPVDAMATRLFSAG